MVLRHFLALFPVGLGGGGFPARNTTAREPEARQHPPPPPPAAARDAAGAPAPAARPGSRGAGGARGPGSARRPARAPKQKRKTKKQREKKKRGQAGAGAPPGGAGPGRAGRPPGRGARGEGEGIVNDAAKQLGVQPSQLSDAIKKALSARVDAAVAAGQLTKEQGAEMKARIASDDFPLFGPRALGGGHFGHHGGPGLDAAAKYLGLTEAQLDTQLESGKTLAEVAKAQDKSVDGLIAALKADAKQKLDAAVKAGRLTQARETRILADLDQRIGDFVNGKLMPRHERGFEGRPSAAVPTVTADLRPASWGPAA